MWFDQLWWILSLLMNIDERKTSRDLSFLAYFSVFDKYIDLQSPRIAEWSFYHIYDSPGYN